MVRLSSCRIYRLTGWTILSSDNRVWGETNGIGRRWSVSHLVGQLEFGCRNYPPWERSHIPLLKALFKMMIFRNFPWKVVSILYTLWKVDGATSVYWFIIEQIATFWEWLAIYFHCCVTMHLDLSDWHRNGTWDPKLTTIHKCSKS